MLPYRATTFLLNLSLLMLLSACEPDRPVYESFDDYPVYAFDDLGVTYREEESTFKLWSPAAEQAQLHLYDTDAPAAQPLKTIGLTEINGAWIATEQGDLAGTYYTFQIKINGKWQPEATDPYARTTGANGLRGQVIDLATTNPPGWDQDQKPSFRSPTDAVLYELHVRDASIDKSSGIKNKGKFLGLTERGTTTASGAPTGLDYLVDLGVTHVHLLPSFDYFTVDETRLDEPQFNWGYDPQNYNVPEGSYSTNPSDGRVRVKEFKQMVQALHKVGIRVVMDVVYNHTGKSEDSHFQQLIPDYFYRFREDGTMSDASGCGNEIASERPMVRKYIRESLAYWMREYHVDGFRFDLMAIHDIPTMNEISQTLHEIDPDVLLYGEGWTAGDSPLPDSLKALKHNTRQLNRIAAFSDDVRDGIKGSVFNHEEKGFATGARGLDQTIRFGVVGAIEHPQVMYHKVNYSNAAWAKGPHQSIAYASCHDNHTLWDRIAISNPEHGQSIREKMHRLALGIVLTSQSIPFLHAGSEWCRTKGGDENSYKSSDAVNALRWEEQKRKAITRAFVRDLIALRKAHPAFRLGTAEAILKHLTFVDTENDQLVVYQIKDAPGDAWANILVAYNGSTRAKQIDLPLGFWQAVVLEGQVDVDGIGSPARGRMKLAGSSMLVLYQQ